MANPRYVEVLRWICVLPSAFLGAFVARYLGGIVGYALIHDSGMGSESSIALLAMLLVYGMGAAAFVLAGAFTAPRHRTTIGIVLAAVCAGLSLLTHVLSQSHPGRTNYLHLTAESGGAALAVACLFWLQRRKGSN